MKLAPLVAIFHGETLIRDLIVLGVIVLFLVTAFSVGLVRLFFWLRDRRKARMSP